jgi:hypothetical protein
VHGASAEEVEVEVFDGLATVGAGVDDEPVALGEVLLAGYFGGGLQEMAEERGVGGLAVSHRGYVAFGDDEDVGGSLGRDVREGESLVVFVEAGYGDGAGGDFAEEAVHKEQGIGSGEQGVVSSLTS